MRHRAVAAVLMVLALAWTGVLPAGAQGSGGPWAGTWDTDLGTWVLEQSGDRVFGTYEPDGGRIFGTVLGDTLLGSWAQAPTYAPPDDAGDLELTLEPDGAAFYGRWRSGSDGEWQDITGLLGAGGPVVVPETDMGPLVLSRVEMPADVRKGRLNAVIAGGSGHIAVGSSGSYDRPTALILTSSAGGSSGTWTPVELVGTAARGDIVDITVFGGGYAAIGRAGRGDAVQVWLSPDGETWEAITSRLFAGARPAAIVEHDGGLFAVGCTVDEYSDCAGSLAWTSTDGRTWQGAPIDLDAGWEMHDAVDLGGRLLLVGGMPLAETPWAVAATSDDAATWEGQEVLEAATLDSVAAAPDGVVLASGWRLGEEGASGLVLRSEDGGATWIDTGLTAGIGSLFLGVAPGEEDTIVYGGYGPAFSEPIPAAWWVDGEGVLGRMDVPDDAVTGMGVITDYVPFGTVRGGVAVGVEEGRSGEQPVIWVVEPVAEGPEATPEPTPVPTRRPTPRPTPRPTATPAANTAAERYLLNGLSRRVRDTCVPNRESLPEGTVAAILCEPDVSGVERVGFYLMTTRDADALFQERIDEYKVPKKYFLCEEGKPGRFAEAGWTGSGICYVDDQGRPNLRIVEDVAAECHPGPVTLGGTVIRKPTVYTGVLGSEDISQLYRAWMALPMEWVYPDGDIGAEPGQVGGPVCAAPRP